jgi:hypothetical protein
MKFIKIVIWYVRCSSAGLLRHRKVVIIVVVIVRIVVVAIVIVKEGNLRSSDRNRDAKQKDLK